jgi:cytoskeleton protein RodZ
LDNWGATTSIGEQLRSARRSRRIELEQIEERTKIRARFLRAMEEDRWEVLPGPAFARAFLRTYADLLGLDSEALVEEYRRGEPTEPAPEAVPQAVSPRRPGRGVGGRAPRGRPPRWGTVAAIALAALVGALVVVGLVGDSGDEAGEPGEPGGAARGESPKGSTPDGKPAEQPPQAPSRATLRLTTTASVWVCLVDGEGNALIEGVTLPPGEEQGPFRAGTLDISAGNGAIEMEANGEPVPVPGAAEPFGYRITPQGAEELGPAERPTCT